jgi:ATP-dependent Lon protease
LSVYDLGEYAFGRPVKITVTSSMGRKGVINIEREADLSGKTHNKGVLILEGFMSRMFAQNKPLYMNASICFEQSYSGVDGDSASSTEIYALLSSLSEVPLRQDLAVTGSVNQYGEIQPIGGINEKAEGFFKVCQSKGPEGFFKVCQSKGLTGKQGVIMPEKNVQDLMLNHEVIDAVQKGEFHIYAVKTISEGIEILTGKKAGEKNAKGEFPKGTINYLVNKKLTDMMKQAKKLDEELSGERGRGKKRTLAAKKSKK